MVVSAASNHSMKYPNYHSTATSLEWSRNNSNDLKMAWDTKWSNVQNLLFAHHRCLGQINIANDGEEDDGIEDDKTSEPKPSLNNSSNRIFPEEERQSSSSPTNEVNDDEKWFTKSGRSSPCIVCWFWIRWISISKFRVFAPLRCSTWSAICTPDTLPWQLWTSFLC